MSALLAAMTCMDDSSNEDKKKIVVLAVEELKQKMDIVDATVFKQTQ
jgi:hypothetical protein